MRSASGVEAPLRPELDAVVCVGPAHRGTALLAVRALVHHARPRRILVLTAAREGSAFEALGAEGIDLVVVDEDRVVPGVSLDALRAYLRERGADPGRAGWYLQQLLKIGACRLPGVADHYLLWDADTVLLRPTEFLAAEGRVLVHPASEHHLPYFETSRTLLGIDRCVPFSFIAESLPVRTAYMRRLVSAIEGRGDLHRTWPWKILDAIDERHLSASGFSEYETYGNFVSSFDPSHFVVRPLRTWRWGSRRFGMAPSRRDLDRLALRYDWVSFEEWSRGRPARIAFEKMVSLLTHAVLHPATPWGRAVRRRCGAS